MTTLHKPGLSQALAAWIATTRYEDLTPAALHATRRSLLDAVGVMLAASGCAPEVRPFVEYARRSGGTPQATILGSRVRVPAALAALANGAMAHALDFEDALDSAPLHPNASLVPAVLAVAQSRGAVTGRELLTALAVGCEVSCRLALSLRQPLEAGGWYPPPILGAFGAVAGCASLLKLNAGQICDAFSLLLLQNSCPGEIKHSGETVIRAVREAFTAQAAVNCTLLAEAGIKGFSAPLEGRAGFYALFAGGRYEPAGLVPAQGDGWYVETLSFKRWPCCRGTHAAVELALSLPRQGFGWRDIEQVRIEGGEVQRMLVEPLARKQAPQTAIDAKFSLPFTVATALVHGDVTLASFEPQALRDAEVLDLAARCVYEERPEWDRHFATAGGISVWLRDGRSFSARTEQALGNPERPLGDADLTAKFILCAARAAAPLTAERAARVARQWLAEDGLADVPAALEALSPA